MLVPVILFFQMQIRRGGLDGGKRCGEGGKGSSYAVRIGPKNRRGRQANVEDFAGAFNVKGNHGRGRCLVISRKEGL